MYRFLNKATNEFIPEYEEVTWDDNGVRTLKNVGFLECETEAEAYYWVWGKYEEKIAKAISNGYTPEAAKKFIDGIVNNVEIVKVDNV